MTYTEPPGAAAGVDRAAGLAYIRAPLVTRGGAAR